MARAPEQLALHRIPAATPPAATPARGRASPGDIPPPVTITRHGLQMMATLVAARLDGPREQQRLAMMDEVLQSAQRLSHVLNALTRHSVMEYRGSHTAWDVRADSDAAYDAFRDYAGALERLASAGLQPERPTSPDR